MPLIVHKLIKQSNKKIIIINISVETNQLKQTSKEVILELISKNKQKFSNLITEILKDIALSKAKEGEETEQDCNIYL